LGLASLASAQPSYLFSDGFEGGSFDLWARTGTLTVTDDGSSPSATLDGTGVTEITHIGGATHVGGAIVIR